MHAVETLELPVPATPNTAQDHYDRHLGPVYAWTVGGVDRAISRGSVELDALGITAAEGGLAVDLGAGFGMHAIPLLMRGYHVVAIDSCDTLLDEIRTRQGTRPMLTVRDDLRSFRNLLPDRPELVLCMGDTLCHLPDEESVEQLIRDVSAELVRGGRFVVTVRDYSKTLVGEQRFIPVRSDESRILTCFLEYARSRVTVHDILHEREGSEWKMTVSAYQKLRLAPEWLMSRLRENGFAVTSLPTPSGAVRFDACRI